jgi:hypothetical protein
MMCARKKESTISLKRNLVFGDIVKAQLQEQTDALEAYSLDVRHLRAKKSYDGSSFKFLCGIWGTPKNGDQKIAISKQE